MIQLINFMQLRGTSWLRDLQQFRFVLETLIESQMYRQFTIVVLKFITSVNSGTRRWYSFVHANLCLNLFVISRLIWKGYSEWEIKGCTHRGIHSRSTLHVCFDTFAYYLLFLCYFQSLKLKENGDTNNYFSSFYKIRRKSFSNHQNTN